MLPLKRPMRNLPASLSRPLPPAPPPQVDFATGLWDSEAVLADPNAVSEGGEPLLVMAVRTNDTDLLGFLVNETSVDQCRRAHGAGCCHYGRTSVRRRAG